MGLMSDPLLFFLRSAVTVAFLSGTGRGSESRSRCLRLCVFESGAQYLQLDGHPVPPPMASAGSLQGTCRDPGSGLGILSLVSTMEEDSLIDVGWQLRRGKDEAASSPM